MALISTRAFGAVFLGLLFVGAASPGVRAQTFEAEPSRYGPRVGFSVQPDQLVLGAFLGFDDLVPGFRARPSIDLGFGDSLFSILLNGDFQYDFTKTQLKPILFAGAGLALAYYKPSDSGDSSTDIGFNLYGGLEFDLGGYQTGLVELRFGIHELPDIKLIGALGFF